jgi:alpha/beta superfamily hydrolase
MRAGRVDERTGIREELAFFGAPGQQMFGCLHLPAGPVEAGVVICPSLQAELLANYRREVLLARRLAEMGLAVHRFHYRGAGNSDGETGDLSFASLVSDALAAAAELDQRVGARPIAFVGVRLGAPIAAAAARQGDSAPLALWEPVTDMTRYVRDILRSLRVRAVKQGTADERSTEDLLDEMKASGWLDVLGYPLHSSLYDSMTGHTLDEELAGSRSPVQLVQMGGQRLRAPYERAASAWREGGLEVETEVVDESEAWWLADDPAGSNSTSGLERLIDVTAGWLHAQLRTSGER